MLKVISGNGENVKVSLDSDKLQRQIESGPGGACSAVEAIILNTNAPEEQKRMARMALNMLYLQIMADRGVDLKKVMAEVEAKID